MGSREVYAIADGAEFFSGGDFSSHEMLVRIPEGEK
jgi:hypothetical protein